MSANLVDLKSVFLFGTEFDLNEVRDLIGRLPTSVTSELAKLPNLKSIRFADTHISYQQTDGANGCKELSKDSKLYEIVRIAERSFPQKFRPREISEKEYLNGAAAAAKNARHDVWEGVGVVSDADSFVRNGLYGANAYTSGAKSATVGKAADALGIVATPLIVAYGLNMVKTSTRSAARAYEIGDAEGVFDAVTYGVAGAGYATAGVSMGVYYATTKGYIPSALHFSSLGVKQSAATAARSLTAVNIGVAFLYVFLLFKSIFDFGYLYAFRTELAKIRNEEGDRNTFNFLASKLCLSPEEAKKDATQKEKILKAKCDALIRRIGAPCAQKLAQLIEKENLDEREITEFLAEVDRASHANLTKQAILLFISIFGVIAVALNFLGVDGAASFSYSILAGFWATVDSSDLNDAVAEFAYGSSDLKQADQRAFRNNLQFFSGQPAAALQPISPKPLSVGGENEEASPLLLPPAPAEPLVVQEEKQEEVAEILQQLVARIDDRQKDDERVEQEKAVALVQAEETRQVAPEALLRVLKIGFETIAAALLFAALSQE